MRDLYRGGVTVDEGTLYALGRIVLITTRVITSYSIHYTKLYELIIGTKDWFVIGNEKYRS